MQAYRRVRNSFFAILASLAARHDPSSHAWRFPMKKLFLIVGMTALLGSLCGASFAQSPVPVQASQGGANQTPAPDPTKIIRLAKGFSNLERGSKLLLAPIDVELFNVTGGGLLEPKADWTMAAQGFMKSAMSQLVKQSDLEISEVSDAKRDEHAEVLSLHAAVSRAIASHHRFTTGASPLALPTKNGELDWSFGDALHGLRDATGAKYALFTFMRDSYASAERKAVMVGTAVVGVLFGVGIALPGGQQVI
jgi:hypothetical protein